MPNPSILSLNCCSLVSHRKRIQLQEFLQKYKPDVALLQETRWGPSHRVRISGYTMVYLPANPSLSPTGTKDVGTAVAIRHGIHHVQIHSSLTIGYGTFVEVDVAGEKALIGSFYLHGNSNHSNALAAFSELGKMCSDYDTALVGGDLNAHVSPENVNGKGLDEFLRQNPLFSRVSPDRMTCTSGNILDHFLLKDTHSRLVSATCRTLDLFSDHFGIQLHFGGNMSLRLLKEGPRKTLSYEGVNWKSFNELVDLKMGSADNWALHSPEAIDKAVGELTEAIRFATDLFLVKKIVPGNKYSHLPDDALLLLKLKNRTLRAITRESNRNNVRRDLLEILKNRLRLFDKELDGVLKKHFTELYKVRIKSIVPGRNMYKDIDRITGRKEYVKIGEIKDHTGNRVSRPEEVAEVFRDHFSETFKAKRPHNVLRSPRPPDEPALQVDTSTVVQLIKGLNGKKSTGPDGISNFLIKRLSSVFVVRLSKLFAACLEQEYFPRAWKSAKILPIFKKKDPTNPANYRPISLVSCLGKLLERILLRYLLDEMIEKQLLPKYQTGFRPGHSCLDAASVLRDMVVHHGYSQRDFVVVCLLDISKAFDSVWIEGLLCKLESFGINRSLRQLITSFLSDREAHVVIGTVKSSDFPVTQGVPQGTVLGPHLYSLFVADQPEAERGCYILQYADDTANIAVGRSLKQAQQFMQSQINRLQNFYEAWGIEVNGGKTEMMVFRPRRISHRKTSRKKPHYSHCKIKIDGQRVEEQESAKYLGILFDNRLRPGMALRSRLQTAKAGSAKLWNLLGSKSLSTKVKKLIYTTLIRPMATYGSPLWSHSHRKDLKQLEVFERKILRRIHPFPFNPATNKFISNTRLHEDLDIPPISCHITKINKQHISRYLRHPNKFIRDWALTPKVWLPKRVSFTRNLRYRL